MLIPHYLQQTVNGPNRNAAPGSRYSLFGLKPLHSSTMSDTLVVNEIYLSLQGESTFAGLPCIFIRLTTCNLRCSYCDTAYAFTEGQKKSLTEIVSEVNRLAASLRKKAPIEAQVERDRSKSPFNMDVAYRQVRLPLVELTGGEPLLQKNS